MLHGLEHDFIFMQVKTFSALSLFNISGSSASTVWKLENLKFSSINAEAKIYENGNLISRTRQSFAILPLLQQLNWHYMQEFEAKLLHIDK